MAWLALLLFLSCFILSIFCQPPPPSTFPNAYPGIPNLPYSTAWQAYFNVSDPLPGVDFINKRSFAGNIDVMRAGHPNNTLFFWAWESKPGSLTASPSSQTANDAPWIIFLNGGPGSSSLLGLFVENGPIHVPSGTSPVPNPSSWDTLADTIWVDQPVGTGWSTTDSAGYPADEDQIGQDFLNFLSNLVKVFPSLAVRPLHLVGESYAGVYIPYITKTIFSTPNPPVTLKKIAIGNGVVGSAQLAIEAPPLSVIETYPQLINYNPDVYNYFKNQSDLCGFTFPFTYPQTGGKFPSAITAGKVSNPTSPFFGQPLSLGFQSSLTKRATESVANEHIKKRMPSTSNSPLADRANGTIDPWYGCYLLEEMWDMAKNFSAPWSESPDHTFNIYDVPDALDPDITLNPAAYINDDRVRTAVHAPLSAWSPNPIFGVYPFGSTLVRAPNSNPYGDPSPEPMVFMDELMANASAHGVSVILYAGNDDSLVPHWGTQVVIQNTTWGGIQGFTKVPSTPWTDDKGNFSGIVHQERGLTYALIYGAGHQVPYYRPRHAKIFLREFILGNNSTGTVTGGRTIGGEDASLSGDALLGANRIFTGSGTTQGVISAPTATVAAWNKFIKVATSQALPTAR